MLGIVGELSDDLVETYENERCRSFVLLVIKPSLSCEVSERIAERIGPNPFN
jgi:hypothetical protein